VARGNFGGRRAHCKYIIWTFCAVSCARTAEGVDFPVWIVDSGGLKEAQVQSYSPGGASVPTSEGRRHLANTIEPSVKLL